MPSHHHRLLVLCAVLLYLYCVSQSQVKATRAPPPVLLLDCDGMCKDRCSEHSRPNVCTRACVTCCVRCKCVPPGTYGNRELCGTCYTDMTTHGNKTKCP